MHDERTLVRTEEQISTTLEGEELILHSGSEQYFGLNEVGTKVWEQLAQPRTVDELATVVSEEFEVSAEQGRADVEAFLMDLRDADLVKPIDATDS